MNITIRCGVLLLSLITAQAMGADVKGSHDHPMVSRYKGAEIERYDVRDFDEYLLINGQIKPGSEYGKKVEPVLPLKGKVTRISYMLPATLTTIAVYSNYEEALRNAGFQPIFACTNSSCGGRTFNHSVVPYWSGFSENYDDQRYLAAKLTRPEGDVYVALYVVKNSSEGGPRHNRIYTQLDIIEPKAMKSGMVTVDADAMAKAIADTGRIALYGIYFDSGKAEVKPESKAALDQIAALLKKQATLKLIVVGHTDNQGSQESNRTLSTRRAEAVRDALIKSYGVQPARLSAAGVGYLAPVASNRVEEGRAKNRRVELVEQ